jgi:hypothetical protein
MKRVASIALLILVIGGGAMAGECLHEWAQGPFYIKVASSYEEPEYYPPNALVKVEHCKKCGVLRLPEVLRGYVGKNLAEGTKP